MENINEWIYIIIFGDYVTLPVYAWQCHVLALETVLVEYWMHNDFLRPFWRQEGILQQCWANYLKKLSTHYTLQHFSN